jgi:hypothetical protein
VCLVQHDGIVAIPEKSVNKKAVFRSVRVTPVALVKNRPSEISSIEKVRSKPKPKRKKLATPKPAKKIAVTQAKLPLPASKLVQMPKAYKSVGAEGWRINCSARFGGWNKASDYYVSSAGKRVSCTVRP